MNRTQVNFGNFLLTTQYDFAQFVEEQKNYRPVADAVAMLLAGNKLSNDELNMLGEMIGEQDIEPLLQAANSDSEDEAE